MTRLRGAEGRRWAPMVCCCCCCGGGGLGAGAATNSSRQRSVRWRKAGSRTPSKGGPVGGVVSCSEEGLGLPSSSMDT